METATEYRLRADSCRWLAALIVARADPVIATLLKLAAEYETKADAIEAGAPLVERDGLILFQDLAASPNGNDVARLAGDQGLDGGRLEVEDASLARGAQPDARPRSIISDELEAGRFEGAP
jgi:hypothetical protein